MKNKDVTVFIIDDDNSVRKSLTIFLGAADYQVVAYSSCEEYLAMEAYDGIGCLILDINLGGKTGLQLQEELIKHDSHLPVIFITGYADIHMSVRALKNGAVNFLEKPFDDSELIKSVNEALELSEKLLREKIECQKAHHLVDSLTLRETEVLKYLITGLLNKQIASQLNIAEQTVKIHRQSICHKLDVRSVPDIIRIAEKAGIIRK